MATIGYARASLSEGEQVFHLQVGALRAAGCERVFDDRGSGLGADKPALQACLDCLNPGDVLVVLDLDRLGQRACELIQLATELRDRGIGFRALNTSLDTTTTAGCVFLHIQADLLEMDRKLTGQRIKEGIAAARARGRQGGRPRVMTSAKLRYAQHLMADQSRSIPTICRELGDLPMSTLYHYLRGDGSLKAPGRELLGVHTQAGGVLLSREESRGVPAGRPRQVRAGA